MSYNTTIIASNNLSLSSEKLKENYFIKLNKHQTKLSLFRQNLMKHEDDYDDPVEKDKLSYDYKNLKKKDFNIPWYRTNKTICKNNIAIYHLFINHLIFCLYFKAKFYLDCKHKTRILVQLLDGSVVTGFDTRIIIWNITIDSCKLKILQNKNNNNVVTHENWTIPNLVLNFIILPNGLLASSYADLTILIWNTTTGKTIKILTGHSDFVFYLLVMNGL